MRGSQIVTPEATVMITLVGRIKTMIVVTNYNAHGTNHSYYRERKDLFGPTATSQTLFQGPLHLPPAQDRDGDDFGLLAFLHHYTHAAQRRNNTPNTGKRRQQRQREAHLAMDFLPEGRRLQDNFGRVCRVLP